MISYSLGIEAFKGLFATKQTKFATLMLMLKKQQAKCLFQMTKRDQATLDKVITERRKVSINTLYARL